MKIRVEPPAPEMRRERIEKKLFAQLAAVEMAERVDAVLPPPRRSRVPYVLGAAALAAAVLALVMFVRGGNAPSREVAISPSRVVTPVNGESRFIVGDAVIDAKSDTSVEVRHGADGAITLVLDRGAVDCDVEPRHGRPPFRVLAGDLAVEVIGTRFTVTRTPSLRVDVARGTVKVTSSTGTTLVEAGESWPVITAAVPTTPPTPAPDEQPTPDVSPDEQSNSDLNRMPPATAPAHAPSAKATPVKASTDEDLAQKSYSVAQKFETSDPAKAAQLFRAIATTSKTTWAATALVSLAEIELEQLHDPAAALTAAEDHIKRFPGASTAQEAMWIRVQALRALGKRDEARGAAADYLRQFPNGAYADRVRDK